MNGRPGHRSNGFCVAVTGLPSSGKSTVGRRLAEALEVTFLDKDAYLEALFEARGIGDAAWRAAMSAAANDAFRRDAESVSRAVLVSHWRPPGNDGPSGTPTGWLSTAFARVVEVHCACSPETAARRFATRRRHPGHLDAMRAPDELLRWLTDYHRHLPLGLGIGLDAEDAGPEAAPALAQRVRRALRESQALPDDETRGD